MKRKLLLAAALLAGMLGGGSSAWAQYNDVTKKYLDNPNFDANPKDVITVTTQGYDYNCTGDQISGLQPVQGWTASTVSKEGLTGGVFAYGSENKLNNQISAPAKSPNEGSGVGLGLLGVWSATAQYTKNVILPPGDYKITYSVCNRKNTGEIDKNLFGFIDKKGTEHVASDKKFPVDQWKDIEVTFTLDRAVTGNISVGYKATNSGSGTPPHIFVDHVSISYIPKSLDEAKSIWEETHNDLVASLPTALIAEEANKKMPETLDEINDAICALQAFIDNNDDIVSSYTKAIDLLENVNSVKENSTGTKTAIEAAIAKATADIETRTTAKEIDADYNTLELARQAYVTSGAQPTEGNPFDYTFMLNNPSFENGINGWTANRNPNNGDYDTRSNNPVDGNYNLNIWNGSITSYDVFQRKVLPAGSYTLTGWMFSDKLKAQHIYAWVNKDFPSANLTKNAEWEKLTASFSIEEETEVKLGMYSEGNGNNSDGWFRADHFQLFYNGITEELADEVLAKAVAKATTIEENRINEGTKAFKIPEEAYDELGSAISEIQGSTASTIEKINAINAAIAECSASIIAPKENTLYNIINVSEGYNHSGKTITFQSEEKADLSGNSTSMGWLEMPGSIYPQGVKLEPAENGNANDYILSYERADGNVIYVGTGLSTGLGNADTQIRPTTKKTEALIVKVVASFDKEDVCYLYNTKAANGIVDCRIGGNGANDTGLFTGEANGYKYYDMQITPAKENEVIVDIAKGKYGTLIVPFDTEAPANATVYSVNTVDGSALVLDEVKGGIKANTPYILYAENEIKDVTLSGIGSAYTDKTYTDGLLTGVYTKETVGEGNYVLQTQDGKQAFYQIAEGSSLTAVPYRAYLTVPADPEDQTAKSVYYFDFAGDATAIEAVPEAAEGAKVFYNLAGQRVANPTKGIYIVNGQKVLVK